MEIHVQLSLVAAILLLGYTVGAREIQPASYWMQFEQKALAREISRTPNTNVAKNVILFLGDGMGVSTVTATRIKYGQDQGKPGEETILPFEEFPFVALTKTYNTDAQTADSAGTATAYLAGVKTRSGVVGYDDSVVRRNCSSATDTAKITSILHWSKEEGKSVGIISTARITHATPSAMYAHSVERDWENDADLPSDAQGKCVDIAAQLTSHAGNIQVVLGGGRRSFMGKNDTDPEYPSKKGKRLDGRNLIREWVETMKEKRFQYVWNKTAFTGVDPENTDFLLGLFEPSHMQYQLDRNTTMEPSLEELTEKAIRILSKNKNGYFLLVEGGRIDHGHHDGKAAYALTEGVELAKTVAKAQEMVDPSNTLMVVTADHSHVFTIGAYGKRGSPILGYANPVDPDKTPLAQDNLPYTSLLYGNGPGYDIAQAKNGSRQNITGVDIDNKNYIQQSAVPLKSETHGGEDVAVYATGPMAHLFSGVKEQSYIAHVMAYASCVGKNQKHCDKKPAPTKEPVNSGRSNKLISLLPLIIGFMRFIQIVL